MFLSLLYLLVCATATATLSQTLEAHITVQSLAPPRVRIAGRRASETRVWSFRNAYAGMLGLAERLENFSLTDADGLNVTVRRLAVGEYESERPAVGFSYEVELDPPAPPNAANVSWLTADYGVLMPGDLLPLPLAGAKITHTLPANWSLATAETKNANSIFNPPDAENAVFFVGRNLRERRAHVKGSLECAFVTTGEWAFTDEEAADASTKILQEYEKIFGGAPRGRALIILAPFPRPASAQAWSAETRGRTVFLLSGRWPSKVAGLTQLNVPLTHEVLHLWVPNALALEGEYDWFYEGFTLYESLRVGVQTGLLSFEDYLNAIGRAFDGYAAAKGREELSLADASRRRWSGSSVLVYNKGLLVACLYDLTLRLQTSNKQTLDNVYRELFRRHGLNETRRDGNAAVVEVLRSMGGMQRFTEKYLHTATPVDLGAALEPFGLQLETLGARTRLTVAKPLSGAQRELLRKLGYNDKHRAP